MGKNYTTTKVFYSLFIILFGLQVAQAQAIREKKSKLSSSSQTIKETTNLDKTGVTINSVLAGVCSNLDFESGDFTGWTGGIGYNPATNSPLVITSGAISTLGVNSPETGCSFHTIQTGAGTDPYGGFPVVGAGGGSFSCRLGGDLLNIGCNTYNSSSAEWNAYVAAGYIPPPNLTSCTSNDPQASNSPRFPRDCSNGETIQQTFPVTQANCLFSYNYAVVMANAPHSGDSCNYFRVDVYDQAGALIPCLSYFVETDTTGQGLVPPGFLSARQRDNLGNPVLYVPWTKNSLNLQPYIGQNITVKFTAAGCYIGGHFCYAYIDCSCGPLDLIIPSGPVCIGKTQTISAPDDGFGGSYSWSGPGIVSVSTTQTITANQPGTYSVTVTNQKGCSYTVDTTITFYPTPTITVNSPTICTGTTTTLTASSASGPAGTLTYNWNPTTGLTFSPGDSVATLTPPASISYNITAATVNGCTNTAVANVTANTIPPPTFSVQPVCQGTATTFTNTTVGGSTYYWNFGDLTTLADTSQLQNPSYIYPSAGNYVVNYTVSVGGGCASSTTQTVTVNPMPTATFTVAPVCQGNPSVFNSTITSGTTYNWDFGDGVGTNTTQANPNYTYPTSAGSPFAVSLTVTAAGGCSVTATGNATVNPIPTATISVQPVCLGSGSVFSSTVTSGNIYVWNFGGAGAGSNIATATPTYIYSAANTFPVTLTVTSAGSCTTTATTNAVVKPIPVVDPIPPSFYCPNQPTDPINFTCQPPGGTPVFTWSGGFGGIGVTQTVTPVPSFTTTNTTTVSQMATFTVNATLNGCQGPNSTFNITVYPNPVASFSFTTVCEGNPVTFTDQSIAYGGLTLNSWQWDMDDNGSIDITGQSPHYLLPVGSNTVNLLVATSSVPSCTAQTVETVVVNPNPVADFSGINIQGCPVLQPTTFTYNQVVTQPPSNIVSWNWDFGNGVTSSSSNPLAQSYSNTSHDSPVYFTISLTIKTDKGCTNTKVINNYVEVYPSPIANFSWEPVGADIDKPLITFVNEAIGASEYLPAQTYGQYGVEYYLGDTYNAGSSSNYVQNNTTFNHNYSDPDYKDVVETYYVTQWVINSYGCKDSITQPVEIQPIFTFYIPNAFSPTGDGRNDGFKGLGIGIDNTTYNLWVFDRWGLMIYHADDIDKAWDGHMLGHEDKPLLQEDVYVWKVKFNDIFGQLHEYHGTVTLVR